MVRRCVNTRYELILTALLLTCFLCFFCCCLQRNNPKLSITMIGTGILYLTIYLFCYIRYISNPAIYLFLYPSIWLSIYPGSCIHQAVFFFKRPELTLTASLLSCLLLVVRSWALSAAFCGLRRSPPQPDEGKTISSGPQIKFPGKTASKNIISHFPFLSLWTAQVFAFVFAQNACKSDTDAPLCVTDELTET